MGYRLLKFDIIHPKEYLDQKKQEWGDVGKLSLEEYRQRLIALRSNYSDFYTYYLNQMGWEAEEFFLRDPDYLKKVAQRLYGKGYWGAYLKAKAKDRIMPNKWWVKQVVKDYIRHFQPDVIFVRSQPLPSAFWQQFRKNCLIVGRLSARLPNQWLPDHFDLLYTDNPVYKALFEMHGVQAIINKQGFDLRINDELIQREKQNDVAFVGGLGPQNFSKRTLLVNKVAEAIDNFRWWGYWWPDKDDEQGLSAFPALAHSFQGFNSGLEMFQTFKDTRINLNDYVDVAKGRGYNQRMFEVMGTGSFLLTREAPNLKDIFPEDIFVTYSDEKDCLDKIRYFLKNEKEREEIAANGAKYVAEHHNFRDITVNFGEDLKQALKAKGL